MTAKPTPQLTWSCLHPGCPETGSSDLSARKHVDATDHAVTTHMRAVSK